MNCIRAITSGQYKGARSRRPHFWYSPKLQLLRIVRISVADRQIIRHSGQVVGGQHRTAYRWEWTMAVTSYSLLLCARARIAPCPEPDRSWPRRFKSEKPKVFLFYLPGIEAPPPPACGYQKNTKFPKREACEGGGGPRRQVRQMYLVYTALSALAAATI